MVILLRDPCCDCPVLIHSFLVSRPCDSSWTLSLNLFFLFSDLFHPYKLDESMFHLLFHFYLIFDRNSCVQSVDSNQTSDLIWVYTVCPCRNNGTLDINEPHRDKSNKMACAPSEDSDQPGHPPSLIRVFTVHSMGSLAPKFSSCGQRRL